MTPTHALPAVLQKIDADLDQSLERLFEFLRIQSISTDPAYKDQCQSAAEYVAKDLSAIGFKSSIRPTDGHLVFLGAFAAAVDLAVGNRIGAQVVWGEGPFPARQGGIFEHRL